MRIRQLVKKTQVQGVTTARERSVYKIRKSPSWRINAEIGLYLHAELVKKAKLFCSPNKEALC